MLVKRPRIVSLAQDYLMVINFLDFNEILFEEKKLNKTIDTTQTLVLNNDISVFFRIPYYYYFNI